MILSVVVPCFNEEDSVMEMLRRVVSVCQQSNISSFEIVVVDDGSSDETWPLIQSASRTCPNIVGVSLARNHGHQIALTAGLDIAVGDRLLIIDADLQDPPEHLDAMMLLMDQGADVVYGQRRERQGETVAKRMAACLFYRILNILSEVPIPRDTGDFRLINRRIVSILKQMPETDRFIRGMISWAGFTQVPFIYDRDARYAGRTKYPVRKMVGLAIDAITGFSIKPLRIASYFGMIFGFVGLLSLIYVFVSWFSNHSIQGWTSLVTIVLLLGSAQLIVLGVIGEYLGRLYIGSKGRPIFLIREIVRGPEAPSPAVPLI